MPIITLTTDLGSKDHYVAIIKGEIYKRIKDINIVDISNDINKFDIQEAAFVFKNSYKHFPEGTVHIIGVDEELCIENQHLAIEINKQYIIGPDNGIFSLILDDVKAEKIVQLNIEIDSDFLTFYIKDVFVSAACHLIRGGTLEMIGKQIENYKNQSATLKAVITNNSIRGSIIHIDSYGNTTTNINKNTFDKVGLGRPFNILYGKHSEKISKIHKKYKDVELGERLAIFSNSGQLEISMNQGKANELLGLRIHDIVRVDFI